jgi:hypothetical protein
MGYACPVCESPQVDGRHLANHLAFTAMIHGGDHEQWLDEHAPNWEEAGEDALAARVVSKARETPFPPTDLGDDHDHDGNHTHPNDGATTSHPRTNQGGHGRTDRADEIAPPIETTESENERSVETVLAEARAMTERMIEDGERSESEGTPTDRTESEDDE